MPVHFRFKHDKYSVSMIPPPSFRMPFSPRQQSDSRNLPVHRVPSLNYLAPRPTHDITRAPFGRRGPSLYPPGAHTMSLLNRGRFVRRPPSEQLFSHNEHGITIRNAQAPLPPIQRLPVELLGEI
ncbi:hypothetical protein Hypma_008577 [Hypsizygus marmoreus]|uniref:Uncharacterized protein n=1 Tax=Hypsizygus marmoreus TaxID=39966 RepID=A0A369JR03_HYPMA|nr:hypothetical protein Hypma_008577 [Hypsizygus marmoreus]